MYRSIPSLVLAGLLGWSCAGDTERRTDYSVHGIDVSHYQGQVIWDSVAAAGIHFAFLKATEGTAHCDTTFERNWSEAGRAGLRRGAYHFFRPGVPAWQQALHFARQVDLQPGDLPPVLDVEVADGVPTPRLLRSIHTWMQLVQFRYRVAPILYTNMDFYNRHLAGRVDAYPLWVARYSRRHPRLEGQPEWQFWQYGQRGRLPGIRGYVDLNIYRGSLPELEELTVSRENKKEPVL